MTIVGVGTDVVAVDRFERLLDRGDRRFLCRWFRPAEVDWLLSWPEPARHTASQFAAKEAALKALRLPDQGPPRWRDIEITHDSAGRADVALHGRAREWAESAGASSFHVAQWSDGRVATATVIAASDSATQPASL